MNLHLHSSSGIRASRLYTDRTVPASGLVVNNQVTREFPEIARKYVLKRRAERQDQTRQRIVDAAVELHTTVGPAHTTDMAIAERAGVTRRTFYRHFPDEVSLFKACTGHTMEMWPPPDSRAWHLIKDPAERLAVALRELYAFYGIAGRGLIVTMRDAPFLRAELRPRPSRADLVGAMTGVLLQGWAVRGRRRDVLRALIAHSTSVNTWQSLVHQQGLTDDEAVEVLKAMVVQAATNIDWMPAPAGRRKAISV